MKLVMVLVIGVACWMLMGCAGQAQRPATQGAVVADITPAKARKSENCREEAPAGSIIKRTRCVSEEQAEKERAEAERSMKSNNDKSNSR